MAYVCVRLFCVRSGSYWRVVHRHTHSRARTHTHANGWDVMHMQLNTTYIRIGLNNKRRVYEDSCSCILCNYLSQLRQLMSAWCDVVMLFCLFSSRLEDILCEAVHFCYDKREGTFTVVEIHALCCKFSYRPVLEILLFIAQFMGGWHEC